MLYQQQVISEWTLVWFHDGSQGLLGIWFWLEDVLMKERLKDFNSYIMNLIIYGLLSNNFLKICPCIGYYLC